MRTLTGSRGALDQRQGSICQEFDMEKREGANYDIQVGPASKFLHANAVHQRGNITHIKPDLAQENND